MRILVVEDDRMIGEAIEVALQQEGFAIDRIDDGKYALSAISDHHYDLLLLDIGLPNINGLEIVKRLRRQGQSVPIIMITAHDATEERIATLDMGADDYLVKPFDLNELLARIRAVLRRNHGASNSVLATSELQLDLTTCQASVNSQSAIALSAKEFSLLRSLMLKPGAILSRRHLEERLYGWDKEIESNAVEFLIHSLRKKLGKKAIRNVRGLGWMVNK